MCMYVAKDLFLSSCKVEKKKIVVYKCFNKVEPVITTTGKKTLKLVSPYQNTDWILGEIVYSGSFGIRFSTEYNMIEVWEGFHSYSTLKAAMNSGGLHEIAECMIPSGSDYIKGIDNQIVSNRLKVVKLIKDPQRTLKMRKKKK